MSTSSTRSVKSEANKIIFFQLVIIMMLAIILFLIKGSESGLAIVLGGLAYWLPGVIVVWQAFNGAYARTASRFVSIFLVGEALKLFISALLLVWVIRSFSVSAGLVMAGFVSAIIAFWIAAGFCLAKQGGVRYAK